MFETSKHVPKTEKRCCGFKDNCFICANKTVSYQIALKLGNKIHRTKYCKLFFRLDGTYNSVVQFFNSTGRDFDSTIKFNASTGEEYCEINDLSVVPKSLST